MNMYAHAWTCEDMYGHAWTRMDLCTDMRIDIYSVFTYDAAADVEHNANERMYLCAGMYGYMCR